MGEEVEREEEDTPNSEAFLTPDAFALVLARLDASSIANAAAVCRAWRSLIADENIWEQLIQAHFPNVDSETLSRAYKNPPSHGRTGAKTTCVSRIAYSRLQRRHVCRFCGKIFRDGTNQRVSCRFHPGILFSGGHHNGIRITWLCCSRHGSKWGQSRADMYSNGCAGRYHYSESSLHAPDFCVAPKTTRGMACASLRSQRDVPVEWTPFSTYGCPSMPTGYY